MAGDSLNDLYTTDSRSETAAPVYALESTMTITLEMQTEVFLGFSGRGFHGLPVMSIRRADAAVTVRRMVSILLIPLYYHCTVSVCFRIL